MMSVYGCFPRRFGQAATIPKGCRVVPCAMNHFRSLFIRACFFTVPFVSCPFMKKNYVYPPFLNVARIAQHARRQLCPFLPLRLAPTTGINLVETAALLWHLGWKALASLVPQYGTWQYPVQPATSAPPTMPNRLFSCFHIAKALEKYPTIRRCKGTCEERRRHSALFQGLFKTGGNATAKLECKCT